MSSHGTFAITLEVNNYQKLINNHQKLITKRSRLDIDKNSFKK